MQIPWKNKERGLRCNEVRGLEPSLHYIEGLIKKVIESKRHGETSPKVWDTEIQEYRIVQISASIQNKTWMYYSIRHNDIDSVDTINREYHNLVKFLLSPKLSDTKASSPSAGERKWS